MIRSIMGASIALVAALPAAAATISYNESINFTPTDWVKSISVQKFDGSMGDLTSVSIELMGAIKGSAGAENFGAEPIDVTLDSTATIKAVSGGFSANVSVKPLDSRDVSLGAADGGSLWGGVGGITIDDISASKTTITTLTGAAMAEFMGPGTVAFNVSAEGKSVARGSGNFAAFFRTDANAKLKVTYTYRDKPNVTEVPLPGGAPLVLVGLGMLGLMRLRQQG